MRIGVALTVFTFLLSVSSTAVKSSPPGQSAATAASADISGVWNFATLTPLERPAQFANKPFLTNEEAAAFEKERLRAGDQPLGAGPAIDALWLERGHVAIVNGRYITSLVSDPPDGRIPELTEAAKARIARRAEAGARSSGPEDRSLSERCLRSASGPPMFPSADANIVQIVQTRNYVVLLTEKFHEARIVRLNSPRLSGALRSWSGDSRGHWEGSNFVIETDNFTDKIGLTGRFDENLHLVERFTRTSSSTLLYEVRIDDPTVFANPWTVIVPMTRSNERLYEFACQEGNYSLANILKAARAAEQLEGAGQSR